MQYNDFPRMENVSVLEAADVDTAQLFSFSFFFSSLLFMLSIRWKQSYSMLRRGMKSSL